MVRKSCFIGFAYFAGLFACTIGWGRNNLVFALAAVCVSAAAFVALKKYRRYIIACTAAFLAAVAVNTAYTKLSYDRLCALDGETVSVKGSITDFSYIGSDTCIVTVKGKADGINAKLSFFVADMDFDYYDNITAKVKVKKIYDTISFQSESYNRPKGVFISGTAVEVVEHEDNDRLFLLRGIKRYRDHLFEKINKIIGGDEGAFAAAMLCGDKSEMSSQTKTLIYRSGIGHIFSVSGTHVIIISSMFGWILKRLCKKKSVIFAVQMTVVWAFAVFAGFSVPVVRAAAMLTAVSAAPLFFRRPDPASSLGLCVVVMLTVSPYAAADCSFLLSFTAAFVIGVICPKASGLVKLGGKAGGAAKAVVNAVTVLLCTMPVQLMFFNEISIIAPLSNILLVPICTTALGITVLTAVTGGATVIAYPVLTAVKYLLKAVILLADIFAKLPFAYVARGVKPMSLLMLLTCLIPVFLGLRKKSVKIGGALTACVLLCWSAVYNFSLHLNGQNIKIMVLPYGKNMQTVMFSGRSGAVFDIGCKGKLNKGMERFMEYEGISDLKCAFISDEQYYTLAKNEKDMTILPDNYYINGIADEDGVYSFTDGAVLEWSGVHIKALEDGYEISAGDCNVTLVGGTVSVNGKKSDMSEEEYPFVIDIKNGEIRRTNYGFAHGFGTW